MAEVKDGELRLPPQDLDAEQAVLGAILIDPSALDKVTPVLPGNAFYKPAHNRIFDAMIELQNEGQPIDTLTLTAHLKKHNLLDKVGGAYFITGLQEALPSAANVEYYARIVREKYVLREVIRSGQDLITEAYEGAREADELLDNAEHRLFDLQRRSLLTPKTIALEPVLHEFMSWLDQRQNREKTHAWAGIPSGYADLDDMTDGFQPSDLVILAGRPSMGKTAFALNIARNAALQFGHRVGLFSMEMSKNQLALRLLTAEAQVNSLQLRRGRLSGREWPRLSQAAGELSDVPIYIDDTAGLDILELRSRIRKFKADFDVEMVIIDYLQLLSSRDRSESRQQEITEITRSLKALARELEITVMALSQLSRAPEQRPGRDKRPIMSDLRESGAIEQDADVILFLYRPYLYSRKEEEKGLAELIIGKQRNGPTGKVKLTFMDEWAKFVPYTREDVLAELPAEGEPF